MISACVCFLYSYNGIKNSPFWKQTNWFSYSSRLRQVTLLLHWNTEYMPFGSQELNFTHTQINFNLQFPVAAVKHSCQNCLPKRTQLRTQSLAKNVHQKNRGRGKKPRSFSTYAWAVHLSQLVFSFLTLWLTNFNGSWEFAASQSNLSRDRGSTLLLSAQRCSRHLEAVHR